MTRGAVAVAAVGLAALGALTCTSSGGGGGGEGREAKRPALPPAAVLPAPSGTRAPSLADISAVQGFDGAGISDVDTCGGCHPDVFAQQQASAHAYSSFNNPVYRVAVDRTRAEVNKDASRMCGGCHDIALLADGAMDAEVEPEDARAHAGVTCRVCHGITSARRDGNGSYSLGREIVLPKDQDPASVEAHRKSVAPLRTAEMCGSCHRSFLDEATGNHDVFLTGQDDLTAWSSSAFNKSGLMRIDDAIEKQDCIACHMKPEAAPLKDAAATDGKVSSHRFTGGHTWLASMLKDPVQLERQRELLRGAVSIDVAQVADGAGTRTMPPDGAEVRAGDTLTLDVVLRSLLVGHRFPGGVLDAQDTWIEVDVRDARGRVIARAGADQAKTGNDPSTHVLRALVADGDAHVRLEREVHTFRAPVVNHTMGPRDAALARFRFRAPADPALPLTVAARLVHRSRNLSLQAAACRAARDPRGVRFGAQAKRLDDPVLDPCAAQPLTVLAETTVELGAGAHVRDDARHWRRRYQHGMALLHALQEHLEEGRLPLERALAEIVHDPTAGARERGMIYVALGRLEGQAGRTPEAMRWLDQAEALMPKHPGIAYARGSAFARVWRWREAAEALSAATGVATDNAGGWADFAMSLGSLGREEEALVASQRGLALSPRDADLLRVQALAVRALGVPPDQAAAALDAYDRHRPPDRGTDLRIECVAVDPLCKLERDPIHVHDMTTP
ncbi:MAG TPA: multiheme c-type cytochrome [Kofleriaceae bacterium]|nr:multiheme c-type cytochrome [Kofleriaceae bacterium]